MAKRIASLRLFLLGLILSGISAKVTHYGYTIKNDIITGVGAVCTALSVYVCYGDIYTPKCYCGVATSERGSGVATSERGSGLCSRISTQNFAGENLGDTLAEKFRAE